MKKLTLTTLSLAIALAAGSALAADAPATQAKGGEHEHMAGHMFEETDTNKDGTISKDEWRAKGDKLFAEIDTNKDGKISPDEMKAHREAMHKKFMDRHEKMGEHEDSKPAAPAATDVKKK